MALQSSGQITLSEIWSEYNSGATPGANENISLGTLSVNTADGGGDPDAMSEFYGLSAAPDAIVASDNFAISTYTGNGGTQTINSVIIGQSAEFNSTSDYIEVNGLDNSTNVFDNGISISAWVKINNIAADNHVIVRNKPTSAYNGITFDVSNTGYPNGGLVNSSNVGGRVFSSKAIIEDQWHHIVLTRTGGADTDGIKIYLDGEKTGELDADNTISSMGTFTYDARIGNRPSTSFDNFYGQIANVRFYSKVLSDSEVQTLAYEPTSQNISISNLEAHFKLDGNTTDATGNYNTTSNSITYADDTPIIKGGPLGQSASFNGTSSKIVLPNTSTIAPTNNFSISLWAKCDDITQDNQMPYSFQAPTAARHFIQLSVPTVGGDGALRVWNSLTGNIYISNAMQSGVWHHIVLTKSSTTGLIVYIDNVARLTRSGDTADIGINTSYSTDSNRIGAYKTTVESNWWNGSIGDFRIYNDVLSSTEVGYIYNNDTTNIPTGNLVAHYKLNGTPEDAGTVAQTSSTVDIFGDGDNIALYKFDNDATDESGNYSFSTNSGNSFINGIDGWGLKLTNSGYLSGSGITTGFPLTLSFYVKTTSSANPVGLLFNKRTSSTNGWSIGASYSSTYGPVLGFLNGGGYAGTSRGLSLGYIPLDAWTHVVVSMTTSGWSSYVNGELVNSYSGSLINNTSAALSIGKSMTIGNWVGSDWAIDQVRVIDRAVSASEAAQLFEITKYDGVPTNVNFHGSSFMPDFIWIKNRDRAISHILSDKLRGLPNMLRTDTQDAVVTNVNDIQSFDPTGFTVGLNTRVNYSGEDFVAFMWKGGPIETGGGTNVTNVTQSVNADAGFSIVKYYESVLGATYNHGLGVQPELSIVRRLDGTTNSWLVLTNAIDGSYDYLILNSDAAAATSGYTSSSTQVYIPIAAGYNYIAYNFVSIDGYQRVGTYLGNGGVKTVYTDSNGDNTGTGAFKPRWVLIKNASYTGNWMIYDSVRDQDGTVSLFLEPNTADAEANASTAYILPNPTGWTTGSSNSVHLNRNGDTFIYLAIA